MVLLVVLAVVEAGVKKRIRNVASAATFTIPRRHAGSSRPRDGRSSLGTGLVRQLAPSPIVEAQLMDDGGFQIFWALGLYRHDSMRCDTRRHCSPGRLPLWRLDQPLIRLSMWPAGPQVGPTPRPRGAIVDREGRHPKRSTLRVVGCTISVPLANK